MSLYRPKGSPYWHFDFQFKGVRHYGSAGVADKEEARAIEANARAEAVRAIHFGGPTPKAEMTVKAAFGRYWEEIAKYTAHGDAELSRFGVMTAILGADRPFSEIDDGRIAEMVARIRGRKAPGKGTALITNATVNRYTEALRRVWRRAARVWRTAVAGDEPQWRLHLLPEADERVRELRADEERALFAALRRDVHPMVRFAITAGLRLGNVIRLTWRQVDLDAGVITIKMKSKKPGGRAHSIPISPGMRAFLAEQRGQHPIYVFTYVCRRSRGKRKKDLRYPFSANGWRKDWRKALAAAGIEDFRFHDTRHTAASRIVRATGNLKVAQRLLGHASIASTTRYAQVTSDDVLAALTAVESRNSPEATPDAMPERRPQRRGK